MNKIIYILFISAALKAQIIINPYVFVSGSGGEFNSYYQAVYDEFVTPPHADTAIFQNALMDSIVTSGYIDSVGFMFCFAQNDSVNALINWISPTGTKANGVNLPSFTRYQGFFTDGSNYTTCVNLNINPTDDALLWSGLSAFYGYYSLTNSKSGSEFDFGLERSTGFDASLRLYASSQVQINLNAGSPQAVYWGSGDKRTDGFFVVTRRNSTHINLYWNYDEYSNTISSSGGGGIPNVDLKVLRAAGNTGDAQLSTIRICSFVIGGSGISPAGVEKITRWIEQYHDAIGIGKSI